MVVLAAMMAAIALVSGDATQEPAFAEAPYKIEHYKRPVPACSPKDVAIVEIGKRWNVQLKRELLITSIEGIYYDVRSKLPPGAIGDVIHVLILRNGCLAVVTWRDH